MKRRFLSTDFSKAMPRGSAGSTTRLTKSLTLVGEYIHTKADARNGNEATEKDFAIGGIFFF